jgi:hypothetical protein
MHASMHVCRHTLTQNMHPCIRVVVHPPARTSACTCSSPYLLTAYLPNYLAHRSKLAVDQTALCAQSSFLICRESNMVWRTVRFAVQVAVQIYVFNQIHVFRYSRFRCHGTCRAIQPNHSDLGLVHVFFLFFFNVAHDMGMVAFPTCQVRTFGFQQQWPRLDPDTCQRGCQTECQPECQIECETECQNMCRIDWQTR